MTDTEGVIAKVDGREPQRELAGLAGWVGGAVRAFRAAWQRVALEVLMELIAESEGVTLSGELPTAEWTQRAAVILRRRGDQDGEIRLLRRYVAICPPGHGSRSLFDRLEKLTQDPHHFPAKMSHLLRQTMRSHAAQPQAEGVGAHEWPECDRRSSGDSL